MNHITCLFLVALKQEIPNYLRDVVPVYTINQLISEKKTTFKSNQICIITGVGEIALKKTFEYISNYLSPQMIVNFGTSGSNRFDVGDFVIPKS